MAVLHPDSGLPPDRAPSPDSVHEVRTYYRTVGRFIDMELAGRNDAGYWRARALELVRPRVLELGAGTGRVTRIMAPHCREVVAVDLSLDMLRRATQVVGEQRHVHLVASDMRRLAFARRFDLALAANDPFVHLATDRERDLALEGAARHLRPGGILILDALWMDAEARRRAAWPGGWQRERVLTGPDGQVQYTTREIWELEEGEWRGLIRYEYRKDGRIVGRAAFRPRFWSPEEVERRLPRAGFRIRRVLGSYEEEPWHPERSSSLIVEAVRTDSGES